MATCDVSRPSARDGGVHVVRALEGAVHGHAVRPGERDPRLGLEICLLLEADLVRPLDDHVGTRERGVRVAADDLERADGAIRGERIQDRREWLRPERDGVAGRLGHRPVRRRDERDRLCDV